MVVGFVANSTNELAPCIMKACGRRQKSVLIATTTDTNRCQPIDTKTFSGQGRQVRSIKIWEQKQDGKHKVS
jgi:hypothetical protein